MPKLSPRDARARFREVVDGLALPVVAAPMFIVSGPPLVKAEREAGILGSFPALNARPAEALEEWLAEIEGVAGTPFAVNQIVHRSNARLEHDLTVMVRHQVPFCITSLGARPEVFDAVQSYGGMCFHDVTTDAYAHKAVEKGADGLILVAAGAGGHAGKLSPFAFLAEVRQWFEGPILLSGAIATGGGVLAARAMGADAAYMGSALIATEEANASLDYKQGVVEGRAEDIVYTSHFTGVHGNYYAPSIRAAGLDPEALPEADPSKMNFEATESGAKAWRDIWGMGQGIGAVERVESVSSVVARLKAEYEAAQAGL
ncbi:NAD(P)H-dependent flavin oxidoreductase [Parvularcula dongshanensis]|uniref:Nitronate monooxygenase n=1 Tax=Parvularcula dongshanensis TaxID=1173995 RepID=A0A840I0J3_9PROT|nr:nitronate monooxygenase family protein [Parvularcula dongshanensis]MBB4657630.1 nitronate monooxygenase [Parvularcula dongshanensis]